MEYLLDARRVDGLHGLVDPEKRSTPCKGREVLAKTAEAVRGGRGRGEMQQGRTSQKEEECEGEGGEEAGETGKERGEKTLTFH